MQVRSKEMSHYLAILFVCLILTCLTACDSSSDDDNTSANTSMNFTVILDGNQAIKTTTARANAELTVDSSTGALSGSVTVSGLATNNDITNVHIHVGNPGESGAAIVTLEKDGAMPDSKWNVPASTQLSTTNLATLLAGGTYLNVHTDDNAAGELRGQILPSSYSMTLTTLNGNEQVPAAVTTTLAAEGFTLLNKTTGELKVRLTISDATNVSAAHIHSGYAGTTGAIALTLTQNSTTDTLYEGEVTLNATQLTAFNDAGMYFSVHTSTNAAGELRGQILPDDYILVRSELDNSQTSPDTGSTATGIGYITVNESTGKSISNVRLSGLDASSVHIHEGAAGVSGGIVFTFTVNSSNSNLWEANGTLTSDQLTKLKADGLYYNAHSSAFASGEIRGQINF